ncbi:MAG: PBSX family phage terminase large subunit [Clostridia bacterium]|nr:PBSX family phage terminase large subunit [Clostridia bacterium]
MKIEKLSEKQKAVMRFGHSKKYRGYSSLICDGAVRSGKTAVMILSFVHWAMRYFDKSYFAICGKTISATERNIVALIRDMVDITAFFAVSYSASKHILTIKDGKRENYFYIFGGKDKSSAALIQGLTLNGVFFDEVALQPKSFVEQAIARTLSVETAKLWFNCNPEHSEHWFYKEWIKDADTKNEKRSLHIHFLMEDNPTLTKEQIKRAKSLYTGIFKRRFVYGEWVKSEGLVYPMFCEENITNSTDFSGEYYISIDYGTSNPFSMGLWVDTGKTAVRLKEFYYDSKRQRKQLTDEEYYNELLLFAAGYNIKTIVIDPSAASFIQTIKRHNEFKVRSANNNVISGIRFVCELLSKKQILINSSCQDIIREFSLYKWDETKQTDTVVKEFDHALDEMRYFCATILYNKPDYKKIQSKPKNQPKSYTENSFSDWGGNLRLI